MCSRISELAEFNFLAGYAVSIFPYEFGDFEDLERQGAEMLLKATEIEPENIIYINISEKFWREKYRAFC